MGVVGGTGMGDWDKGDGWLGALWNGSDAPGPATHKSKVKEGQGGRGGNQLRKKLEGGNGGLG